MSFNPWFSNEVQTNFWNSETFSSVAFCENSRWMCSSGSEGSMRNSDCILTANAYLAAGGGGGSILLLVTTINMITNALMRAAHDKAEVTEVVPFANNYLTYVTDGFNKAFQTPYPKEDSLKGRMYLFIL